MNGLRPLSLRVGGSRSGIGERVGLDGVGWGSCATVIRMTRYVSDLYSSRQ